MRADEDIELGDECKPEDEEHQALLPASARGSEQSRDSELTSKLPHSNCSLAHLSPWTHFAAFVTGVITCILAQYLIDGLPCLLPKSLPSHVAETVNALAPPFVGSTEVHNWPPASPTNTDPVLFPTSVGYAGTTPTGAEPALIATAPSYPVHTGAPQLIVPATHLAGTKPGNASFDLFKHWGNLSPWYSVPKGTFGIDSGPETPAACRVTGLHFLHRHGARYPTSWGAWTIYLSELHL
jgi:hypothetical protein